MAAARLRVGPVHEPLGVARAAAKLGLTGRELEVLALLATGRSNAEIGKILVISPRTVGVHVSQILHKLGATRRTEVASPGSLAPERSRPRITVTTLGSAPAPR